MKPEDFGCTIVRHSSKGVDARQTFIPAGVMLDQHVHEFPHLAIVGSGTAQLTAGGVTTTLSAGACVEIKAGMQHSVMAMTDVIWFCIWPDSIEVLES